MDELRQTPIQRVLYRENLLMGGERELMLMVALVAGGVILSAQQLWAVMVGVPFYIVGVATLRYLAKIDPYLSKVYARQLRYQPHYPARSTPFVMER